jgi:hypothetical protein
VKLIITNVINGSRESDIFGGRAPFYGVSPDKQLKLDGLLMSYGLTPIQIVNGLTLRNRLIKKATDCDLRVFHGLPLTMKSREAAVSLSKSGVSEVNCDAKDFCFSYVIGSKNGANDISSDKQFKGMKINLNYFILLMILMHYLIFIQIVYSCFAVRMGNRCGLAPTMCPPNRQIHYQSTW